jgi:hypothetical protein
LNEENEIVCCPVEENGLGISLRERDEIPQVEMPQGSGS